MRTTNSGTSWLWARCAICALAAGGSPGVFIRHSEPVIPNAVLLGFPLAAVVLPILLLASRAGRASSREDWHSPSWTRNPFNVRDPLQLIHLAAWFFLMSGVPSLARSLLVGAPLSRVALVASGIGIGLWLGLQAVAGIRRAHRRPA